MNFLKILNEKSRFKIGDEAKNHIPLVQRRQVCAAQKRNYSVVEQFTISNTVF